MDDDYVLKYIPIMTDKAKNNQCEDIDDFYPWIIEEKIEQLLHNELKELAKKLWVDEELNEVLEDIFKDSTKDKNFKKFRKKLVILIARTNIAYIKDSNKLKASTTTKTKKDANSMYQSMKKFTFSDLYQDNLHSVIQEQLLRQYGHTDPFMVFDEAINITKFIENLSPLMIQAAEETKQQADALKGRSSSRLETLENYLKQKLANNIALGMHFWMKSKVSGAGINDLPTNFSQLFVVCCKKAGFGEVSNKADQIQKAVNYLKNKIEELDSKKEIQP